MGDVQAVRLFEQFHYSGHDAAIELTPSTRPDHQFLLEGVHRALVDTHEARLKAAGEGVYERVAAMRPDGGVASIWSERALGLEAGCHVPRALRPPHDKSDIPQRSVQPIPADPRLFVANEAFGTKECWAEGSLVMAENVVSRLGVGRPSWLPESVYAELIFGRDEENARDAAGQQGEARRTESDGKIHATDLMMLKAAMGRQPACDENGGACSRLDHFSRPR